jgi:hypothetical protein
MVISEDDALEQEFSYHALLNMNQLDGDGLSLSLPWPRQAICTRATMSELTLLMKANPHDVNALTRDQRQRMSESQVCTYTALSS